MEKHIKSFDGAKIGYYDNCKDSKNVIFLVHGWVGNRTHWKNHFDYLRKMGYRVIAMDIRGYGKSQESHKKSFYSFKNVAKDMNEILNKEKIAKITLAGFSMGGMISLVFLSMFQKKAERLILASTSYAGPEKDEHKKNLLKFVHIAEARFFERKGHKNVDFTKNNFLFASADMASSSPFPTLVYLENILGFDSKKMLSEMNIPVLIISGKNDALIPVGFSRKMSKIIKNSRYVEVDFGHSFIIKNGLARKIITDFLKETKETR